MKKQIIVTTSWDDGHLMDRKLAVLLKKYGIKGTFYISPENREFKKSELLPEDDIGRISMDFEIGAHTMTHPDLTKISSMEASREIEGSKDYLEGMTGTEVNCFAYPGGKYNRGVTGIVRHSGFCYSRTVKKLELSRSKDFLAAGTTLETHRNSFITFPLDSIRILAFARLNPVEFLRDLSWKHLAKRTFDHVEKYGGIYHLWGHSWVIEKGGYWNDVEDIFSYISKKPDASYFTNYEMFRAANENIACN